MRIPKTECEIGYVIKTGRKFKWVSARLWDSRLDQVNQDLFLVNKIDMKVS